MTDASPTQTTQASQASQANPPADVGPDPVVGAGLALTGMAVMGLSGGLDAHYPFLVGALLAVAGAVTFVVCVGLSAWKRRALVRAGGRA